LSDHSLTIKGKGSSVADCVPLLCIPSNHAYIAQVEINIEGNANGGLVLFYNNTYYSGILADKGNILANLRGWQFPTEKHVIKDHVFLRIKNIKNTVDMYYSTNGQKWSKIENSIEVSGYNHNVLSGFLGLRLGLCAVGDGIITFKNFVYQPIK
jgi:beta-xylosidase